MGRSAEVPFTLHRARMLIHEQAELLKKSYRRNESLEREIARLKAGAESAKPIGAEPVPKQQNSDKAIVVVSAAMMNLQTFMRHCEIRHNAPLPGTSHTPGALRALHAAAHLAADGTAGHEHGPAEPKNGPVEVQPPGDRRDVGAGHANGSKPPRGAGARQPQKRSTAAQSKPRAHRPGGKAS